MVQMLELLGKTIRKAFASMAILAIQQDPEIHDDCPQIISKKSFAMRSSDIPVSVSMWSSPAHWGAA
jgi:hypothetical protein